MIGPLTGKARRSVERSNAWLNIWDGPVRSGKTVASIGRWLHFVKDGPPGPLVMVGKTERTLKRNILDPLSEIIGAENCRQVTGAGEVWIAGRKIYTAGANDERSMTKIQGSTFVGAYGDELSVWPESFFKMMVSRLSVDGAKFFGTTNPDGPYHYLKTEFLDRAGFRLGRDGSEINLGGDVLDLARFTFVLDDNPHLSETYKDQIRRTYVGLWHKRYILGLWVLAEGAIYDMFGPEHVTKKLPEIVEWYLAIDYGTTNPFMALLVGVGADDRLYVCREWRWDSKRELRQLTDAEYSERLERWLKGLANEPGLEGCDEPYRIIVDPSAASFINQLFNDGWAGVHRADNAVSDGIRETGSLLAARLLSVHESCKGLKSEMESYVWSPKAARLGKDEPLKQNDHGPDALRYLVRGTANLWQYWLERVFAQAA